ncbi:hypothetical protein J7M00_02675 [bacterium]|nr:hypothetical protein [bacterium]
MRVFKIIFLAISVLLGVLLLVYGIKLQDILEVITNGSILCLSCVGIG